MLKRETALSTWPRYLYAAAAIFAVWLFLYSAIRLAVDKAPPHAPRAPTVRSCTHSAIVCDPTGAWCTTITWGHSEYSPVSLDLDY